MTIKLANASRFSRLSVTSGKKGLNETSKGHQRWSLFATHRACVSVANHLCPSEGFADRRAKAHACFFSREKTSVSAAAPFNFRLIRCALPFSAVSQRCAEQEQTSRPFRLPPVDRILSALKVQLERPKVQGEMDAQEVGKISVAKEHVDVGMRKGYCCKLFFPLVHCPTEATESRRVPHECTGRYVKGRWESAPLSSNEQMKGPSSRPLATLVVPHVQNVRHRRVL